MAGTNSILCPFGAEWTVVRELGRGSYGSVYLIERRIGEETIQSAMKVIRLPVSDEEPEEYMRRTGKSREETARYYDSLAQALLPEIQLMSKLRGDSHIVSYEDHAVQPRDSGIGVDIYIRMEYLESLPHWIKNHDLTNRNVVDMGIQLCESLETCAFHKIVHRDIKPANIFVAPGDTFKLGDFGISLRLDAASIDADERKLGSLNYIAPEVKRGNEFDSRVDIYGLGMVMYRLLNYERIPFLPEYPAGYTDEQESKALERRFAGERLPRPANATDQLWAVIEKACEYHPERRYDNATEMKRALLAIASSSSLDKPLPKTQAPNGRDGDTSKRTRSTGPNGTELRSRGSNQTPTRTYKKLDNDQPQPDSTETKKRRLPIWAKVLMAVVSLAILGGALFVFMRPSVGSIVVGKMKAELTHNLNGAIEVKLSGGTSPFHLDVYFRNSKVDMLDSSQSVIELETLVPGEDYTLKFNDATGKSCDLDIKVDLNTDPPVASKPDLFIYECDRSELAMNSWVELSNRGRAKRVSEIVLRDATIAAQNNHWDVMVQSTSSQSEPLPALLVLHIGGATRVTQQITLSAGTRAQTLVDMDELLEKAWTALRGQVSGSAALELYIDGRFIKDERFVIKTDILDDRGEN